MPATSRNTRLRAVSLALGLIGLGGLALLVLLWQKQPWLRGGLLLFAIWQGFWYLVRIGLMVGIWRRETGLSARQKLWLAVTAPLPVLLGVWAGRGRLSAWIEVGDADDGRVGGEAGAVAGVDPG